MPQKVRKYRHFTVDSMNFLAPLLIEVQKFTGLGYVAKFAASLGRNPFNRPTTHSSVLGFTFPIPSATIECRADRHEL
jgi:hypothetical protein